MAYTAFHQFLKDAKAHHYAVGAFNVANMETLQAVAAAAEEAQVPVIAQVYHAHLDFAGAPYISAIGRTAAQQVTVPLCLSLDHGQSIEQARLCIANGFNGVMIDLATSDYQRNVADTRQVVEEAHAKGCSVEAELGEIFPADMPAEVRNSAMTDPELPHGSCGIPASMRWPYPLGRRTVCIPPVRRLISRVWSASCRLWNVLL